MPSLVTLAGIDEAIGNLALREDTLKYRLIQAIRSHFPFEESLAAIDAIPTEEIIRQVWETDHPEEIQQKRKNFSSTKSSLNKHLRQLSKKGLNPEGVILGRDNNFIVSEEKKNILLEQLGLGAESALSLKEAVSSFQTLFANLIEEKGIQAVQELLAGLEQTKAYLEEAARREGLPPGAGPGPSLPISPTGSGTGPFPAGGEATSPQAPPADSVLGTQGIEEIEVEQIFFEDEIEEAELPEDDPAAAPELPAAEPETEAATGANAGESAAAIEEIETDQIFFEDEIEEAELPEDDPATPPDSPATDPEAESAAGTEAGESATAEEGIDAEEIFYEDEIEPVGLGEPDEARDLPEEAYPEAAGALAIPGGSAGDPAAAGTGEEEQVIETEALFYEDEIEELDEVLAEPRAASPNGDNEPGSATGDATALEELLAEDEIEEVELLASEEVEMVPEGGLGGEGCGSSQTGWPSGGPPAPSGRPGGAQPAGADDTMGLLEVLSQLMGDREGLAQDGPAGGLGGAEPYLAQLLSRFAPRHLPIPAGSYQVGSLEPQGRELPRRQVRLSAFRLGQFPVTNDLFELFVRETGHETEAEKRGYGLVYEGRFANHTEPDTGRPVFSIGRGTSMRQADGADWRHPAGPGSTIQGRHRHPVVQVTLADALAFARWAGKRLPTEEEWEAAAGANDGRPFPWGRDWSPARANVLASHWGDTTAVDEHGRDAASPFGISGLIGNVYEWTATLHSSKEGSVTDDHGGHQQGARDGVLCKRPQGAADARHRSASYTQVCEQADNKADVVPCDRLHGRGMLYVLKGGSWATAGRISIGHRMVEKESHCSNIVGFRCAG